MFVTTSLPVGGAEVLLRELVRRLDRARFQPEICCLKDRGALGEALVGEVPLFEGLIRHRTDVMVLGRLVRLFRERDIQAVVTVGAGDKMFWGRIAAFWAGVPAIVSALHSTGWPDDITWPNRILTPLTDAFVAVADGQSRHLASAVGLPPARIRVIRNGIDVDRFQPRCGAAARRRLGLPPDAPVVGIVAALRPEKNHEGFLRMADRVRQAVPGTRFLIVGDGPRRAALARLCAELRLDNDVRFVGESDDVPSLLAAMNVVTLTSLSEASPVSVLEAMAAARPVVAYAVGSVGESVADGLSGYLIPPGDDGAFVTCVASLLRRPDTASRLGQEGHRRAVESHDVRQMVHGYEALLTELLACAQGGAPAVRIPR